MSEQKTDRRIYKSRKDKIVDGVCGGFADYFDMDPTLVRIIWFVSFFLNGLGFWAYVIGAIIIPPNPEHTDLKKDEKKKQSPQVFWGFFLITLGAFFLFKSWNFPFFFHWPFHLHYFDFWWGMPWGIIGPAILIGLGAFYIYTVMNEGKAVESASSSSVKDNQKKLARPVHGRTIAGVCAAFANYFQIDPTWIRVGCALLAVLTQFGPMMLLYLLLIFIIPKESETE